MDSASSVGVEVGPEGDEPLVDRSVELRCKGIGLRIADGDACHVEQVPETVIGRSAVLN